MRNYKASGKIAPLQFLLFTLIGLLIAAVLGVAAMLIAQLIYLVPLSPLIMAAISGALAALVTRLGRNRSPLLALIVGLLIGGTIYGVYRFSEYGYALYTIESQLNPKGDIVANVLGAFDSTNIAQVDRTMAREGITQSGFPGFIMWMSSEGMTITRFSSSSSGSGGITLDQNMTLIYWAVEALLVVGVAAYAAVRSARAPYDENAGQWISDDKFKMFGTVDGSQQRDFVRALEQGNWQRAGSMMMPGISGGQVIVQGYKLGDDFGDVLLRITQTANKRSNQVAQGVLSMSEFKTLLANASRAAQPSAYGVGATY